MPSLTQWLAAALLTMACTSLDLSWPPRQATFTEGDADNNPSLRTSVSMFFQVTECSLPDFRDPGSS